MSGAVKPLQPSNRSLSSAAKACLAIRRWLSSFDAVGVLVDYFAMSAEEFSRHDLDRGPAAIDWPYVDCKGWMGGLDQLAAELTGRDPSEFGDDTHLGDQSGEVGWGVCRVASEVTQAMAGVSDEQLQAYGDAEMLDDPELQAYTALRDLARAAVNADREIYWWWSL